MARKKLDNTRKYGELLSKRSSPPSGTNPGRGRPGQSPAGAVLNLLGLAARAGGILTGTDQVRKAVREGKVHYVMVAADASPTQQQKLVPLLDARQTQYHIRFSREQLGSAVGRAPISAVGVSNPSFARRVAEIAATLPSLQD